MPISQYLNIHDEIVIKRIRYWIDILGLIKASSYIVWHFICVCITLSFTGENPTMTLALCYTSLNFNLTPTMQKVSPLVKPLRARGDTFRTSEKYPPRKFTRGVKFHTSQKYPPGILFRGDALLPDTGLTDAGALFNKIVWGPQVPTQL